MPFLVRAVRLLLSRRAVTAVVLAARARKAAKEWYPVRVDGISMLPTLRPGDLLAVRFPRPGEPRAQQIVVVAGREVEMVKRITGAPGDEVDGRTLAEDEFWVEGDNPNASTDSRDLGAVARKDIMGIVRSRYWPPTRARNFL